MPKELIRGSQSPYGEETGAQSVVDVRWDRETGYFQIATHSVGPDGQPYIPDYIREMVKDGPGPEVFFAQDGWYVDLDRRGINDLIRVLRRARDQAFGRDE